MNRLFSLRALGCVFLSLIMVVCDQVSKWAVSELVIRPLHGGNPMAFLDWIAQAPEKLPYASLELLPFYNTVMVWNYGMSFGVFNDGQGSMAMVLTIVPCLIAFAFFVWMIFTESRVVAIALALVVGGAIGNVIDRVRFGAVIDFMDFHIGDLHWPAFNVADMCVVIGIFILLMHSFFFEKSTSESG